MLPAERQGGFGGPPGGSPGFSSGGPGFGGGGSSVGGGGGSYQQPQQGGQQMQHGGPYQQTPPAANNAPFLQGACIASDGAALMVQLVHHCGQLRSQLLA